MISLDTETNGRDFRHGSLPFYVTTCNEFEEHQNWIWDVDPYTRQVRVVQHELDDIFHLISSETVIIQNAKFDVTALGYCEENKRFIKKWPWKQTYCTLMAGHLLGSGYPHDLTSMVSQYLNTDMAIYEVELKEAVQKARRMATKLFPDWMIAKEGLACLPSAKEEVWRNDYWLPLALVAELGYDGVTAELNRVNDTIDNSKHGWDTIVQHYSNADSYFTSKLWPVMETQIRERDLWEIYESRMKLLPIALDMEDRGVTLSASRREKLLEEYRYESTEAESICVNIASEYIDDKTGEPFELTLPKSGRNDKLSRFIFDGLKLPVKKETKKGNPSLDKDVLEQYEDSLPAKTPELLFVQKLRAKRKRDTAISYMDSYERYWIPVEGKPGYYTLHPNLNPTGTAHLRWSCDNPNEQNISKQKGFNLRWMFGPAPGREWWSLDAQNIELRIPVFEAEEREIMDVFLRPNDPPYYGSYHLVIFDLLHPELFKRFGKRCKDEFESDWYQWVKNGNFAVIYGAQEKKADATYHVDGAFKKIRYRFPNIAKLSDRQIARANKTGGIETIPDRSVNPRRGYPIMCARSDFGKVQPTLPLNYHVSGTAMQWTGKGMIRCHEQLQKWNNDDRFDGFIAMQVHDEMVFDMPASKGDVPTEWKRLKENPSTNPVFNNNAWRIRVLQQLMEKGGEDIGIPTPVGVEYNPETWDKFVAI